MSGPKSLGISADLHAYLVEIADGLTIARKR